MVELDGAGIDPDVVEGIPSAEAGHHFLRAMYAYGDLGRQEAAGQALVDGWSSHRYLGAGRLDGPRVHGLPARRPAGRADRRGPFGLEADERLMTIFAVSVRALVEAEAGHLDVAIEAAEAAHQAVTQRGLHDAVATAIAHEARGAVLSPRARSRRPSRRSSSPSG